MTHTRLAYILVAGALGLSACSRTQLPDLLGDDPYGTGATSGIRGETGGASSGAVSGTGGSVVGAGGASGSGGRATATGGATSSCAPGDALCTEGCTDLLTDPLNCGECSVECGPGETCDTGQCVGSSVCPPCPSGTTCVNGQCVAGTPSCFPRQTVCEGRCVNLRRNPFNCGACGNVCPGMEACRRGQCVP